MYVLQQQGQFQEGGQGRTMSRTTTTTSIRTNNFEFRTTQNQEGENDEDMHTNYMIEAQSMIKSQAKVELKSNLSTSPIHPVGVGFTKTDARAPYELHFGHSRFCWNES
jgi:hypothetical protein